MSKPDRRVHLKVYFLTIPKFPYPSDHFGKIFSFSADQSCLVGGALNPGTTFQPGLAIKVRAS
jgi:hypothetical protein